MSELHRTLEETVFYPPHPPRKASAEYKRVHHRLVVEMDEPCWICGVRHSTGGAMETHHDELEWAAANGVDLAKIIADFPAIDALPGTDEHAKLRAWLDGEGNMLVLCALHHRGLLAGIHSVTYPAWKLQRWQGSGWQFIRPKEPPHA